MGRHPNQTGEILDAVALLVVDMQPAFLDAIPDSESVIARCAFAVQAASLFGIEVIFTEQVPEKLGHTVKALRELAPQARVFSKNTFPALAAPGIQEHLRRRGVYHLLLGGIETPICIYQTALQAQDADLDVTVVGDCVAGRRAEDSRMTLDALSKSNCHVLPSEAIFYSMLGSATHPRFSQFTQLVKHYAQPDPLKSRAPVARSERTPETSKPGEREGERERDGEGGRTGRRRSRRRGRRGRASGEARGEGYEKPAHDETRAPESPAPTASSSRPESPPQSRSEPQHEPQPEAQPKRQPPSEPAKPEKDTPASKPAPKKKAATRKRAPAKKKTASTAKTGRTAKKKTTSRAKSASTDETRAD